MSNYEKSLNRLYELIKESGDEGISLAQLTQKSGMKEHGVKSLAGTLVKREKIVRHQTLYHYFDNVEKLDLNEHPKDHVELYAFGGQKFIGTGSVKFSVKFKTPPRCPVPDDKCGYLYGRKEKGLLEKIADFLNGRS